MLLPDSKGITNHWICLKTQKLSTEIPCPVTDPQIMIGLIHTSKLFTNANMSQFPTLKTILHESGLGAFDTKY